MIAGFIHKVNETVSPHRVEGLHLHESYAEVAAALDLSPGSVGTTVRRAEAARRKELERHASSD